MIMNFALDLFPGGQGLAFLVSVCGSQQTWIVAILRSANKHFNKIIVQAVVELALQVPGKLGMIEIARMDWQHVSVHRDG